MNHSSPSDYLDAVMEAGFLPVESDELPNDLAWLAKSGAEAYREEPETVTIVYEDDTVVEVKVLTRNASSSARPASTKPNVGSAGSRPRWRCNHDRRPIWSCIPRYIDFGP